MNDQLKGGMKGFFNTTRLLFLSKCVQFNIFGCFWFFFLDSRSWGTQQWKDKLCSNLGRRTTQIVPRDVRKVGRHRTKRNDFRP